MTLTDKHSSGRVNIISIGQLMYAHMHRENCSLLPRKKNIPLSYTQLMHHLVSN